MSWDTIIGQDQAKALLQEQINNAKMTHAYLFIGPQGVGKKFTAEIFARALNCLNLENKPCNTCKHCMQIIHGNSINVSYHAPEGKKFKIEQIRSICKHINLKLEKESAQVIILDGCDHMTQEAANNLLKTLEEPPVNTYFILLAEEKSAVLPTVISRCQVVLFTPVAVELVAAYLEKKLLLTPEKALTFARIAQGSLANAEKIATDEAFLHLRDKALEIFLFKPRDAYDILKLSLELEEHKDQLMEILDILRLLTRDALIYDIGSHELIINRDKLELFSHQQLGIEENLRQYKLIDEAINRLKFNANRKLTLDTLLLALKIDRRKSA